MKYLVAVVILIIVSAEIFLRVNKHTIEKVDEVRAPVERTIALVYNGHFADPDSAHAIMKLAQKFQLKVVTFSDPAQILQYLPHTRLIAIGGTIDDIASFPMAFKPQVIKAINDFIASGGSYLGICGGAYIASTGWDDGGTFVPALGLAPFGTENEQEDSSEKVMTVDWKNQSRAIYYQLGPRLLPNNAAHPTVIARYDDGTLAAGLFTVGKGKVYLVGPHPEADASWIHDEMLRAEDWKPTDDLADDMMADVLGSGE